MVLRRSPVASFAVALCYWLGALLACFACMPAAAQETAAQETAAGVHAGCCPEAPAGDSAAACKAICQSLPAQPGPQLDNTEAAPAEALPVRLARGLRHGPEPPPPRLA